MKRWRWVITPIRNYFSGIEIRRSRRGPGIQPGAMPDTQSDPSQIRVFPFDAVPVRSLGGIFVRFAELDHPVAPVTALQISMLSRNLDDFCRRITMHPE